MLIHAVCFKYKPEVDAATRANHREQIRALANLDGIVDLKIGEDIVHSARSYDTGLVIIFPDAATLDAYQKHPRHVPVAQFGISVCDSIVTVDFHAE